MTVHTAQAYSLAELKRLRTRGKAETRTASPTIHLEPEFWDNVRVLMPATPPGKTSVHLRLDSDVLRWFKAQGRGHLTRMNAILRAFMEAQK
jgi:uncharacterized protein (DUF4415 family)